MCVSIEKSFLNKVEKFKAHNGMSRSGLIRRALEEYMRDRTEPFMESKTLFKQVVDLLQRGN